MKNGMSLTNEKQTLKQKILRPDLSVYESGFLSLFLWWLGLSLVPLTMILAIPTLAFACMYSKQFYDKYLKLHIDNFTKSGKS